MATKTAEAKSTEVENAEDEFFDYSHLSEDDLKKEEARLAKIVAALANRKNEFANKAYITIEKAMKDAGISPRQMIDYLQPKAELEGVDIRWVYKDEKNKDQIKDFWDGKKGANSIKNAIKDGKLSKEDALKCALTEKGKQLVEEWTK